MKITAASLVTLAFTCGVSADVAFDNFGPGSTFTGSGWLIQGPQSPPSWTHAFPFVPTVSGQVTTITAGLHHLSGATNSYVFELRSNAAGSPGPVIGILGQTSGFLSGETPIQFAANAGLNIVAGTTYWIYARGEGDATGTWRMSPTNGGVRAYSFDGGANFTIATLSTTDGQGSLRVEVAAAPEDCYANCDGSTNPPTLNSLDFGCFLTKFAAGAAYANCDGSTNPPQLNSLDFGCFLTKFAAGCT